MDRGFTLTDEEVVSLPVDVLALEILRDIVANPEPGGEDANNWLGMAAQRHQQLALDCLIEAWNWLYSNGLVATDLEKQHRPGPEHSWKPRASTATTDSSNPPSIRWS